MQWTIAWDLLSAIYDLAIPLLSFAQIERRYRRIPACRRRPVYSHTLQLRGLRWLFNNVRP